VRLTRGGLRGPLLALPRLWLSGSDCPPGGTVDERCRPWSPIPCCLCERTAAWAAIWLADMAAAEGVGVMPKWARFDEDVEGRPGSKSPWLECFLR
jgi:hypothetical protein